MAKPQLPGPDEYDTVPGSKDGRFPPLAVHRRSHIPDREILWAIWDKLAEIEAAIKPVGER